MFDHFSDMRLQRGAKHLHALGPRVIAEYLVALSDKIGGMPAALALLVEYERLTPAAIKIVGADRFPAYRPRMVPPEARS